MGSQKDKKGASAASSEKSKKDDGMVEFQNYQFEMFDPKNPASRPIISVRSSVKDVDLRFDFYKYMTRITESDECKAYNNHKDDIIKKFNESQEKLKKEDRKSPTLENLPELQKLFDKDSGFKVKKFELPNEMCEGISTEDMIATDWIFNFIKKK